MRILVTGGAGFIGSNIAAKLDLEGHQVTILDDLSTGFLDNTKNIRHSFIKGSVADPVALDNAMAGQDAIFHLAARVGNLKSIEQPFLDCDINYIGMLSVLESMRKHKVSKLIYSSTAAGYGEPTILPIPEDHPINPDSPYGVSKIAAEKLALCYGRLYSFQVTCLRYFNAYGINQRYDSYGNVIPIFVSRLMKGEPLIVYGDGEQTRDFVNVQDIVSANLLALNHLKSGYFNIASGKKTSIRQLVSLLKEISGQSIDVIFMDPRKGEVLNSYADINKAQTELGYVSSVSIKEGLAEYWQWYTSMKM